MFYPKKHEKEIPKKISGKYNFKVTMGTETEFGQ